jgi:hypothetical protein
LHLVFTPTLHSSANDLRPRPHPSRSNTVDLIKDPEVHRAVPSSLGACESRDTFVRH